MFDYKHKQGPQGLQKFSSLKSLKIQKPTLISSTFTPATIRKWLPYPILGSKTVRNVQINPQTTEIWPIQLNVP